MMLGRLMMRALVGRSGKLLARSEPLIGRQRLCMSRLMREERTEEMMREQKTEEEARDAALLQLLNTATKQRLRGIGVAAATIDAICQGRQDSPFQSLHELESSLFADQRFTPAKLQNLYAQTRIALRYELISDADFLSRQPPELGPIIAAQLAAPSSPLLPRLSDLLTAEEAARVKELSHLESLSDFVDLLGETKTTQLVKTHLELASERSPSGKPLRQGPPPTNHAAKNIPGIKPFAEVGGQGFCWGKSQ